MIKILTNVVQDSNIATFVVLITSLVNISFNLGCFTDIQSVGINLPLKLGEDKINIYYIFILSSLKSIHLITER